MKTRVLDSWAILEWMNGNQPATGFVAQLLSEAEEGQTCLLMSAINVGEVYYFLQKQRRDSLAESWRESARSFPAMFEVPSFEEIWRAASLKGQFPISYADAFAAGLAQKYNCPLVTGDPEFQTVTQLDLHWIGRAPVA